MSLNVSSEWVIQDQKIMSEAKNYFLWQFNLIEPFLGKRVLEIGCGIGNFTMFLTKKNCHVLAVDIDEECLDEHRQRFGNMDRIQQRRLDAMSPDIQHAKDFAPDTIICLNVLEHIEDDAKALDYMFQTLEPNGNVCLIVPAYEALRGPIDNATGHYRRYTMGGLRKLSLNAGFHIAKLNYMNVVGFFGWWLNAKVFKRTSQSLFQVKTFDRFIVPVVSTVESMVSPPFGQNIFAVLVKPKHDA